ncbi:MAG TPA: tetratricopeptide repeat protein [Terracidiphilus sp.]|nr:tetratricopeptide repeat protein [Terracidiphilus sp.]
MDTQTRHALKGDKFAQATKTSVTWLTGHRVGVVRWSIAGAVVIVLVLGGLIYWSLQSSAAEAALGAAMDAYTTPLAEPGAPPLHGEYATTAERSKAANKEFLAVADKYGWLAAGAKAHYFAGVTYEDIGQSGPAEAELKKAESAGSRNLSNLAKLALASLYRQTGRDAQAIDAYKALIAKPSTTVPATVAELNLADLYSTSGKREQARVLWAKVRDADKNGAAGSIAAQKLAGQ